MSAERKDLLSLPSEIETQHDHIAAGVAAIAAARREVLRHHPHPHPPHAAQRVEPHASLDPGDAQSDEKRRERKQQQNSSARPTSAPGQDPPQGAEPLASVRRVLPVLKAAAKKFRDKHGRPPVLIIDNMDRLVNEEPKVAELLQDFAQDCADASSLLLVFIVNSGEPLAMLRARSSWSRADQPPIEVEDLSDSQAVDYMVRRGVDPNIAREAVTNICGGRFVILNRVCEQLLHKMPLEDVKRQQLINARFEYHRAGLLTQGPVRQYGWRLAEALLNAPGNYLLSAEFDALVPDAAIQKHLLDQSVFTFRQSVDTVAFKNRPVLVYARDHLKAMQK